MSQFAFLDFAWAQVFASSANCLSMPISLPQAAKRAYVILLCSFARQYEVGLSATRDSSDKDLAKAHKKVLLKAHPDKGGSADDTKKLNEARDRYEDAKKVCHKQSTQAAPPSSNALVVASPKEGFRIHSSAVLLTYNGLSGLDHWRDFLSTLRDLLRPCQVWRWCATLEKSKAGNMHVHLMLQFHKKIDSYTKRFAIKGLTPNGSPHGLGRDLLGEGLCRKRLQQSVDRGMFYVWADKRGTCRDEAGEICVDGNYMPAWMEDALMTYRVLSKWAESLWQAYKLDHSVYGHYLLKSRDGYLHKKRLLDAVVQGEKRRKQRSRRSLPIRSGFAATLLYTSLSQKSLQRRRG